MDEHHQGRPPIWQAITNPGCPVRWAFMMPPSPRPWRNKPHWPGNMASRAFAFIIIGSAAGASWKNRSRPCWRIRRSICPSASIGPITIGRGAGTARTPTFCWSKSIRRKTTLRSPRSLEPLVSGPAVHQDQRPPPLAGLQSGRPARCGSHRRAVARSFPRRAVSAMCLSPLSQTLESSEASSLRDGCGCGISTFLDLL